MLLDEIQPEPSSLPPFENNIIGITIMILGILGLISNLHLLNINYTRNKGDILTNHLLIANALLCFIYPVPIYSSFHQKWAFSDSACQLYGFLGLFFGYAIMSAITMIVVDEYLMFNSKTYTAKRLRLNQLMILFVWLSSLFWSLCPLFGWSRFSIEPYGTACTVVYFANDGYESYIIAVFLFYYLTPLIFLAYAKRKYDDYKKVDLTDEKNAAKLSVRWKPFSRNLSLSKLYFFKNGTLMLLLNFLICWTPYTLTYLWPIIFKSNINIHFSAWSPVFAKITPIFTAIIFKREEIQSKKSEEN